MVVNKDYKNWLIAYYCYKFIKNIENNDNFTYCIIHDNNKYIGELVNSLPGISFLQKLDLLPIADYYLICRSIKASDYERISEKSKNVINIYQSYDKYELSKTPINYLVDEYRHNDDLYYQNYITQKDDLANKYIQFYIKNCYDSDNKLKLFNKIEIETINRCNNICSFCPVNRNEDKRKFKIMTDDMYFDIIYQLNHLKYSGAVGLFSNNEPLLDKKIVKRCSLAREMLPNAFIYIYTNGVLLNKNLLSQLLKYLDYIYIDNYCSSKDLIDPLKSIHKFLTDESINHDKISIHLRNQNEILSTRGGKAPNKKNPANIESRCLLPFSQMVIQPNGKVSLCSNDPLGQMVLGDVTNQSLVEIWYGKEYEKIRMLIQQGRENLEICQVCDAIFTPLPFERIDDNV